MCWIQILDEEYNASSDTASISTDLIFNYYFLSMSSFYKYKLPNALKILVGLNWIQVALVSRTLFIFM